MTDITRRDVVLLLDGIKGTPAPSRSDNHAASAGVTNRVFSANGMNCPGKIGPRVSTVTNSAPISPSANQPQ